MIKKSLFLLGSAMLLVITSYAQEKEKIHEAGIVFQDVNSYGLTYRFGSEKSLWRLSAINLSSSETDGSPSLSNNRIDKTKSFSGGIKFGHEWRNRIAENFYFRSGVEVGGSYGSIKQEGDLFTDLNGFLAPGERTVENWGASLEVIMGFNYVVKERLVLGIEILPGIEYEEETETFEYDSGEKEETDNSTISGSMGLTNATLSIAYRFNTK